MARLLDNRRGGAQVVQRQAAPAFQKGLCVFKQRVQMAMRALGEEVGDGQKKNSAAVPPAR